LIKPSNLEWLFAVYGQVPIRQRFIFVYRDPCDYHFVLLWRKLAGKEFSVCNRVDADIS